MRAPGRSSAPAAVVIALLVLAFGAPAAHGANTLCWWGEGFTWGGEANGGPDSWTHMSTWRTWSNPNSWLGRRYSGATVTYEDYQAFGGYDEFVNASNNWRSTYIYAWGQGPYNPGTNWRWEQWSTIGC